MISSAKKEKESVLRDIVAKLALIKAYNHECVLNANRIKKKDAKTRNFTVDIDSGVLDQTRLRPL